MTNVESVRAVINKHFQRVTDLGDGILRGERVHKDKSFAVAYIDLSDSVIERSQSLTTFQEQLLGADFFSIVICVGTVISTLRAQVQGERQIP